MLYAESRTLLPVNHPKYKQISLEALRGRLSDLEKEPVGTGVWDALTLLFRTISLGSAEFGVPVYDGELFKEDERIDRVTLRNEHFVKALQALTEFSGRGIDYQNLGVRHLGSIYEALLEYSVRQAPEDLVIYKEEILDAKYTADLKQKPQGYVNKGDLYLSVGGLARKGTGSYYTPDEIVSFLVKKGLEPHFERREKQFLADLDHLRSLKEKKRKNDPELTKRCTEDMLGLKVVDPAMGSGHFLVAVVDEITRWIVGLLKEHPDAPLAQEIDDDREIIVREQLEKGIELEGDLLTDSVILKRMVMKRCVYGVDVNLLAVELAKLSLWLDSFTIGTPLTFLDHHIRCGDSLIGLWLKNISGRTFETTLDRWTSAFSAAGVKLFEVVSMPADLTIEQVDQSRQAYSDVRARTEPLRILLDLDVASRLDPELGKRLTKNVQLIEQAYAEKGKESRPEWWGRVEEALALSQKYRAFHWEFEFPDAFSGDARGFDLVIMNPPWEAVKPEDDDFFSSYYPRFRRISSKPEKRKVMESLLENPQIASAYQEYRQAIEQRVLFYKESGEYVRRGSGDTNLWKLFLERGLKILVDGGSLSIVIPSGIVTDEGGKQLRESLFEGKIRGMFEFENKEGIFPDVHRSYKFILLIWDKAAPTQSFQAAFYLHDIDALNGKTERDKFVELPLALIGKCAPDSLSIPEVRNKKELEIFSKIYNSHPLLNDPSKGWTVALVRELDRTGDSDLFRTDGKGWALVDGKSFNQFIPNFEKPVFTVDPSKALERTAKHREYERINVKLHETVRLAFRGIASSTNVRTVIACILPPRTVSDHNVDVVIVREDREKALDNSYYELIAYLAGILNSFVFDFLVRTRISIYFSFFAFYQTPVPALTEGLFPKQIKEIAARLSSTDERYVDLAASLGVEIGQVTMNERIELTARLNALVAKHYGLTAQELEVILNSFDTFRVDVGLAKLEGEIKWSDDLIRRFNGEVRKRVLRHFGSLEAGS